MVGGGTDPLSLTQSLIYTLGIVGSASPYPRGAFCTNRLDIGVLSSDQIFDFSLHSSGVAS